MEIDNPVKEKAIRTAVNDMSAEMTKLEKNLDLIAGQLPSLVATREDINSFKGKLDEYDNKLADATSIISNGVKVNASIRLSTDHADTLDDLRDELAEKRKRFEKLLSTLGSKSLWVKIVFAILASAVSFGISHLIFVTSKYKWAHRAYIAAVAANRENPGEEYAKAWIGFQEEGRKYKSTVKVLETTAKMVKNLESILADYIEEEFEVREYDLRIKTEQQCVVVCYHPSKDEKISYRIHTTPDGMVTRVEKEIRKKVKGKSSQITEWVEIDRKAN